MSRMLWSAMPDPLFITDEHSIEYRCVAVLRKQWETCWHLLLLVGFQQYVSYQFAQLEHLPCVVQLNSDCFIRNLEAFGKLTTHLTVVFFGYVQGLIIQDLWLPLRGVSQRDRFPKTNLLETMLMVHSLTVYFQRLDALDNLIWPRTSLLYVIKQTTAKWVASTPLFLFTIAKAIPTVNFQCACFG